MAPSLPALLEAAEAQTATLEKQKAGKTEELEALEAEVAAKREIKTIAAQSEVRELLKQKDSISKDLRVLTGACGHVAKAIAKLKRGIALGLDDWTAVHEEQIKLNDFLKRYLKETPDALASLQKTCGGSEITLKDGALLFVGSKATMPKLTEALSALESNYETHVDCDDASTSRLLEARGELKSLADRHGVAITREGDSFRVAGAPQAANKAADFLKFLMEGKDDLDCPKHLIGAAKPKAKETEQLTGAYVEVLRTGGWEGGGSICIRGTEDNVKEAVELFRAWLDEKEGATSEFVDIGEAGTEWRAPLFAEFRNDLSMMGQKFYVMVKETATPGKLEVRGPPDAVKAANQELKLILDFYKKKHADEVAAQAKAAAAASKPPDDDWGAAPTAEPEPCSWGSAPVAEPPPGAW